MFCIVLWSASPVRKSLVADWVPEAGAGAAADGGAGAEGASATAGTAGAAGWAGAGAVAGGTDADEEEIGGGAKVGLG